MIELLLALDVKINTSLRLLTLPGETRFMSSFLREITGLNVMLLSLLRSCLSPFQCITRNAFRHRQGKTSYLSSLLKNSVHLKNVPHAVFPNCLTK